MGKSIRQHRRDAIILGQHMPEVAASMARHQARLNDPSSVLNEDPDYSWNPRVRDERGIGSLTASVIVTIWALFMVVLGGVAAQRIADYNEHHVDAPYQAKVTKVAHLAEDDPGWNCLTMGNHRCGPAWKPAPPRLVPGHTDCLWRVGPTSYFVCPDGYVTTS